MKKLFIPILLFTLAVHVEAYTPIVVSQESLKDITSIEDPTIAQTYYGQLNNFPHTYVITATEPLTLSAQIFVPSTGQNATSVSGIIVKLPQERGRVTEISRLLADHASWEKRLEPWSGDTYNVGPRYEGELAPGTYHLEVHTPNNKEQYILVVGTRNERMIGYFDLLSRLIAVKRFMGKSPFHIVESPFVYVPIVVIILMLVGTWYFVRKKKIKTMSSGAGFVTSE